MSSIKTQNIDKIAKKYDLNMMLIFGSQTNDKTNFDSDVDIAYSANKELTGKQMIDMNCDLIDVFKNDKIDMVDLKKVNPFLRQEIAKNSKILYGDEMDYLEFKAYAFRSYIDHQPLFELQDLLLKKKHEALRESIYGK